MTRVRRLGPRSRSVVTDAEIEGAVVAGFGADRVDLIEREVSRYATSSTVEDVSVHLADGSRTRLLLKDLASEALLDEARSGKPAFLADPLREVTAYRVLLPAVGESAARCYAAVADGDRPWLLLEKVPGVELYQVGEVDVWAAAAAVVARLHRQLTVGLGEVQAARVIRQDAAYHRSWMERALRFESDRGGARLPALEAIARVHEEVIAGLERLPPVLLHGDLYASNVLVVRGDPPRICPVDWEMASLGPAVLDLAALSSGTWSEAAREEIAGAYRSSMEDPRWRPGPAEFAKALDLARLQVCVQWLGWAPDWAPPQEHAQDWLTQAHGLVDRLFG